MTRIRALSRPVRLAPLLLSALLLGPAAAQAVSPDGDAGTSPARLVRVPLDDPETLRTLLALDLDLTCGGPLRQADGRRVQELIADDDDLRALADRDIPHTVVIPDLVGHYRSRLATPDQLADLPAPPLGAGLSPPFGQGGVGGFYTWSEVVSVLDQLTAAHPAITTDKQSLGLTDEGRDIWMVKISDNPDTDEAEPEVRVDAMHHAREPQSMQSVLWFMLFLLEGYGNDPLATWLVDEREIYFVPVVNPDGFVHNQVTEPGGGGLWRKNRADNGDGSFGVDLNRNYPWFWGFDDVGSSPFPESITYRGPSAASELETQAMLAFMAARDFATAISAHSSSNVWLTPWGWDGDEPLPDAAAYDEISAAATPLAWPYGPGEFLLNYPANGVTNDTDQADFGTLSWTPEIGTSSDGFWPSTARIVPLAEEVLPGLAATAAAAGAWVRVLDITRTDEGDGDGHPEAGESLALVLDLRNSGLEATPGNVALALSTPGPHATVTTGARVLLPMPSFSSADNGGAPLRLDIDPATPAGTLITYTVSVSAGGHHQEFPGAFVVGEPRPFVRDDVEVDLGWIVGDPADTAATGLWERGDPIGIDNGGQPMQPEDDHSVAPGTTQAFITGNGSTSAGGDDVDDGITTLVSPPFDLSGVGAATIGYARWVAVQNVLDDTLDVSLSNDDGQTWTPLESVGALANAWATPEFIVPLVLPQTDAMRLRFVASDDPNNSLVEALVDDLEVTIHDAPPRLNLYGEPVLGGTLRFHVAAAPASPFVWLASPLTANLQVGNIQGPLLLDPGLLVSLFSSSVPADGLFAADVPLPAEPSAAGLPIYFQALVIEGGVKYLTNRATGELSPAP